MSVVDQFNYPDGPLADQSFWEVVPWSPSVVVASNAVTNSGAQQDEYIKWVGYGQFGRHQLSRITIDSGSHRPGVTVYNQDGQGCYEGTVSGSGTWIIDRIIDNGDGTYSNVDFGLAAYEDSVAAPFTGDTIELEVNDDGNGDCLLTLRKNGTDVLTYTDNDTERFTEGQPGFTLRNGSGDNDTTTQFEGDDFADGVVVTDSFDRANETLTDSSDWTLTPWGANSPIIENNQVRGAADDQGHSVMWDGPGNFGRRQSAQATLGADNEQAGQAAIAVYMGSHGSYHFNINYNLGEFNISRYDASADAYENLESWVWNTAPVAGDTLGLEVNDDGNGYSRLLGKLNDTVIIEYVDDSSDRYTSGKPGFLMYRNLIRLDDFTAQAYGDVSLSNVTVQNIGETSADVAVTTSVDDGTLYMVVTQSATDPTKSQIKNGNNHNGSAAVDAQTLNVTETGQKSFSITGLSKATAYYVYFMHEAASGVQSAVTGTGRFSLTGASVTFTIQDVDGNPITSETGIEYWVSDNRDQSAHTSGDDGETDGSGSITIDVGNSGKSSGSTVVVEARLADGRYGVYEAVIQ